MIHKIYRVFKYYTLCFGAGSAGYAMAISNVLFLVILIIAMLQRGMMKREASEI